MIWLCTVPLIWNQFSNLIFQSDFTQNFSTQLSGISLTFCIRFAISFQVDWCFILNQFMHFFLNLNCWIGLEIDLTHLIWTLHLNFIWLWSESEFPHLLLSEFLLSCWLWFATLDWQSDLFSLCANFGPLLCSNQICLSFLWCSVQFATWLKFWTDFAGLVAVKALHFDSHT